MPRRRSVPGGGANEPTPDHLRCRRSDGRRWRCSSPSLPGSSLCSRHLPRAAAAVSPSTPPPRLRRRRSSTDPRPAVKDEPAADDAGEASPSPPPPPPPPPPKRRKVEPGERLPDHLRCRRSDGKKWRCPRRALPSVSFCEYHYERAKHNEARLRKGPSPSIPADGELLVAALRRQADKKKKKKKKQKLMKLSPPAAASELTRDLPNGLMTISPVDCGGASSASASAMLPEAKIGCDNIVPVRRCYRSKNAEPVPVGPLKEFPGGMGLTKVARRTCHRCGRKNAARVVKCLNCANQFFCLSCIKKWFAGMSKKDIKMRCPVCRRCCNCKQCTQGETADVLCKESESNQSDRVKIKYADSLLCHLLPVLKINQEQIDELEIEAKIQGTKISKVHILVAESGRSEPLYCNNCKLSARHFLRSCPQCSFKLCLTCCQRMREGSSLDSVNVDTTVVHKKEKTKKSSSTTFGIREQFSAPVFAENGSKFTQLLVPCKLRHEEGSILCPSDEVGGCGKTFLSLIYTFPSIWTEEFSIGVQRKASSCNYTGMIDVLPHCSSLAENNDNLARYAVSSQETLAM